MLEEDPKPQPIVLGPLDRLSIGELEVHIAELETRIADAKAEIAKKTAAGSAADSVFKM